LVAEAAWPRAVRPKDPARFGFLAVLGATMLWGYSNVAMRQAEASVAPSFLMWLRFVIPLLVTLPVLLRRNLDRRWLVRAVAVGAVLGVGTYAQAEALATIGVDQMAFISALYVVFTPIAAAVLGRRRPDGRLIAVVALSLFGVALLVGGFGGAVHAGTWWSLVAALAFTGQILALSRLSARANAVALTAAESLGAVLALSPLLMAAPRPVVALLPSVAHFSPGVWLEVLYLALVGGLLAYVLQAWGQRHVSPSLAALTFNTESVWSAVFAWAVLAELLRGWQWAGALLTLGALVLPVAAVPGAARGQARPRTGPERAPPY
jgi:drug/metabolite transporter (DMT)-like permease